MRDRLDPSTLCFLFEQRQLYSAVVLDNISFKGLGLPLLMRLIAGRLLTGDVTQLLVGRIEREGQSAINSSRMYLYTQLENHYVQPAPNPLKKVKKVRVKTLAAHERSQEVGWLVDHTR